MSSASDVSGPLPWQRQGRDWPNRHASRFVSAGGLSWHVQQMGQGPAMLMLHGTGASTHSWRALAPLLARRFTVIAMDLPGHGFTDPVAGARQSLPAMARATAALIGTLGADVQWVVGHSAGAAIAARLILDRHIAPRGLIGLNAAMLPIDGVAGMVFPIAARLMALNSLAPRLFAWRALDRHAVERLIAGTGSTLDARGIDLYAQLVRDRRHVAGALAMMANWRLSTLVGDLHRLTTPSAWLVGERDRAVPLAHAQRLMRMLPAGVPSRLTMLCGAGHLAHEERPDAVERFVLEVTGAAVSSPPAPMRSANPSVCHG